MDLVVAHIASDDLSILLNDDGQPGSFRPAGRWKEWQNLNRPLAVDLNQDGRTSLPLVDLVTVDLDVVRVGTAVPTISKRVQVTTQFSDPHIVNFSNRQDSDRDGISDAIENAAHVRHSCWRHIEWAVEINVETFNLFVRLKI